VALFCRHGVILQILNTAKNHSGVTSCDGIAQCGPVHLPSDAIANF